MPELWKSFLGRGRIKGNGQCASWNTTAPDEHTPLPCWEQRDCSGNKIMTKCSQEQGHRNELAFSFFLNCQSVQDFLRASLESDCHLTKQRQFKINRGKAFCLKEPEVRNLLGQYLLFIWKLMSQAPQIILNTVILNRKYCCSSLERKELGKQWDYFLELIKIILELRRT